MSKRKNKKNSMIFGLILALVGIASMVLFLLLPVLGYEDSETTYNGLMASFGGEISNLTLFGKELANLKMDFNILGIVGLFLPVFAGAIVLIAKKNKFLYLLAAVLFIGGAVLMFLITKTSSITGSLIGYSATEANNWALGYGAIISGVLSGLGGFGALYLAIK